MTRAPSFPVPVYGVNASALPRPTDAGRRKVRFVSRVVAKYGESYRAAAVAYALEQEQAGRLPRR